MFWNLFLLEQRGAREVTEMRHMMTNQEMQRDTELMHEAREELKMRGESFRGEVRQMISEIRE